MEVLFIICSIFSFSIASNIVSGKFSIVFAQFSSLLAISTIFLLKILLLSELVSSKVLPAIIFRKLKSFMKSLRSIFPPFSKLLSVNLIVSDRDSKYTFKIIFLIFLSLLFSGSESIFLMRCSSLS